MLVRLLNKHLITSIIFFCSYVVIALLFPVLLHQENGRAIYEVLTGATQTYVTVLWWSWVLLLPFIFTMIVTKNEMRQFFLLEFNRYTSIRMWMKPYLGYLLSMQGVAFIPVLVLFIVMSPEYLVPILLSSISLFFWTTTIWLSGVFLIRYFRVSSIVLTMIIFIVTLQFYMHLYQFTIGSAEVGDAIIPVGIALALSCALIFINLHSAKASYFIEGGKSQ